MTGGQRSPRTVLHVLFYLNGKMFLPNGGNHSQSVIAPCPRRTESSATQLLQPQIQILAYYCFQVFEFPNDVLKIFNDLASIPLIRNTTVLDFMLCFIEQGVSYPKSS